MYVATPHTRRHTNPRRRSDITPHHWFLPNLQPPPWEITQCLSSHQGVKYTPLESNRGGWRDRVVRGQEVASSKYERVRFGDGKWENADGNVCVTEPEGAEWGVD